MLIVSWYRCRVYRTRAGILSRRKYSSEHLYLLIIKTKHSLTPSFKQLSGVLVRVGKRKSCRRKNI
jgi:hypothetical protein